MEFLIAWPVCTGCKFPEGSFVIARFPYKGSILGREGRLCRACNILNPVNSESQRSPYPSNPAKATETSKSFKYHSFNFPFFTIDPLIMAGKVIVRAAVASGR